jgi:hypothetical protein
MYGPPRDCNGIVRDEEEVCANVFVNKGEGVVKDKHLLFVAWSNALSQGFRDQARAEPPRITFGGTFSTNHQYGHQQRP